MKRLFMTSFLQVALVSANTYFISKVTWLGIAICGFGISYIWTINVKQISISSTKERIVYATGAMLGGLTGVALSRILL